MLHKGDRHNVKIPAYCLMTNHLHVVAIPAKEGSLFLGIPDIVYRESLPIAVMPDIVYRASILVSCRMDAHPYQ